MSRHEYTPPGWPSHCSFVIGWDEPLGTYFGLVSDKSLGSGDDGNILAAGGEPPHFDELDKLMRVVNGRIKGRLPPIQLPQELRRGLRNAAAIKRPVVNGLTLTSLDRATPAGSGTSPRPCGMLGTTEGYLEGVELQETFDGMADQYVRLERLYLPRKAAGLTEDNDADTKLIRVQLGRMGMACEILQAMVHSDTLVARSALQPLQEFSAEAARVLEVHSADAVRHSEAVH